MNLADVIARRLRNHKNLIGVSAPEVRAVVAETCNELDRLAFPEGTTLDDALNGEWEACESCERMDLTENMRHDDENTPLCAECMESLIAEGGQS